MKRIFYLLMAAASVWLMFSAALRWKAETIYPLQRSFTRGGALAMVRDERHAALLSRSDGLYPGNYLPHALLGKYYLYGNRAGGPEAARREFSAALSLNPYYTEAMAYLSWIEFSSGKPFDALNRLETALKSEPYNYFNHLFYGICISNFIETLPKNLRDIYIYRALEEFNIGLDINPYMAEHPTVLTAISGIYLIKGDIYEAVREMEKLKGINDDNIFFHLRLAELYLEAGDEEKSGGKYSALLDFVRAGSDARVKTVSSLVSASKKENGVGLKLLLGRAYFEGGEKRRAVEILKEALRKNPEHSEAHYLLAQVYESLGEKEAAYNHYLKTLERNRSHGGAEKKVLEFLRGQAAGGSFDSSPP